MPCKVTSSCSPAPAACGAALVGFQRGYCVCLRCLLSQRYWFGGIGGGERTWNILPRVIKSPGLKLTELIRVLRSNEGSLKAEPGLQLSSGPLGSVFLPVPGGRRGAGGRVWSLQVESWTFKCQVKQGVTQSTAGFPEELGEPKTPKPASSTPPHHPHPRCPCGGRVSMGAVAPAAPSHVAEPQLNSFAVILAVILLLQLSSVFLVANPSCSRQGPPSQSQPPFLAPSPRCPRLAARVCPLTPLCSDRR